MIKEAIARLVKKEDLTADQMNDVMEEIMTGEATDAQKAAFLTALAAKGETIDEITASARVLRSHCEKFLNDMDVLEIVGTGGDGSNSINISTLASIVVSAAGIPVAKHGNRAASSKCGTADCLEALGVKIDAAPARMAQILKRTDVKRYQYLFPFCTEISSSYEIRRKCKKGNWNPYIIQCTWTIS